MNKIHKYQIYMLIVTIFWGMSYVFTKIALEYVGTFEVIFFRFFISFLVTFSLFYKNIFPIKKDDLKYSAYLSIFLFLVFISMTFGLKYTTASNAGFLASISVIFIPLLTWLFNKEKPKIHIYFIMLPVIMGILLLTVNENLQFHLGDILCLLCAIFFALHIVFTSRFVKKVNPISLGIFQFMYLAFFSLIFHIFMENTRIPNSFSFWHCIFCLSLFCTAFGYTVQTISQQAISSNVMGFIICLEPVFSAVFGYFLLGETLTLRQFLGAFLILFSVLWISLKYED